MQPPCPERRTVRWDGMLKTGAAIPLRSPAVPPRPPRWGDINWPTVLTPPSGQASFFRLPRVVPVIGEPIENHSADGAAPPAGTSPQASAARTRTLRDSNPQVVGAVASGRIHQVTAGAHRSRVFTSDHVKHIAPLGPLHSRPAMRVEPFPPPACFDGYETNSSAMIIFNGKA